jgi:hypothetical protein
VAPSGRPTSTIQLAFASRRASEWEGIARAEVATSTQAMPPPEWSA